MYLNVDNYLRCFYKLACLSGACVRFCYIVDLLLAMALYVQRHVLFN